MDTTRRVPGRAYQKVRDPERLLIEERAEALSAAGTRCQMMIRLCTLSRGSKRPRRLVQRKLLAFPNKLQLRKICGVREK